jgi:GalNAc5-diNAcBac-PP-undecaprenol beta-1,3-glucosyltransferase
MIGSNSATPIKHLMFSVVIPTHNRCRLVSRAIESVLRQNWAEIEIIVIDDASTDETENIIRHQYPQVRYFKQHQNQGPGPARQRGIQEATHPWVILLDDDDQLIDQALQIISFEMAQLPASVSYPVLMFAHSNGYLSSPFMVLKLDDYLNGRIKGDMISIINRSIFLEIGLSYPSTRLGGEHLLWWKIADNYGIPAWNRQITIVGKDAARRLTSFHQQIFHAEEHAQLQEMTLAVFEKRLKPRHPGFVVKKHFGAAIYWLLAAKPWNAQKHIHYMRANGKKKLAFGIHFLSVVPTPCLKQLFAFYRFLGQIKYRYISEAK